MLTRLARKALRPLGVELVSREEINFYRGLPPAALLYSQLQEGQRNLIAAFHSASKSQLGQDLFALAVAGSREPHYFVEFGATDGLSLSNTYLLEKELHWQGLIAEPAKFWHERLRVNRSCNIDTRCVWTSSGKSIKFLEAQPGNGSFPELSSIEKCADNGDWASSIRRNNSITYDVDTVSLNDLLDSHNAPKTIQFMSIDTEGSELDILRSYSFGARQIMSICVEHNYQPRARAGIYDLLTSKGYKRVFEKISKCDDWYVLDTF